MRRPIAGLLLVPVLIFYSALFLNPSPAAAQTNQLAGLVTDETGAFIVAATVKLDDGKGHTATAESDEAGHFRLRALPPGTYTLTVSAEGFDSSSKQVDVIAGQNPQIKVTLKVQIKEQMEVKSDSAGISTDPDKNLSSVEISGSELESLPDDPDELLTQLKNMAGSSGSPGDTSLYVDGFEEGGRLPPKEAIQMIKINSDPFSAAYPEHGVGRIEVITRPGALDFHGGFRFNFDDAALDARKAFAPVKAALQTRTYNGDFSGPIIKNKWGFFFSIERREDDENAVINATTLDPVTLAARPFVTTVQTPYRLTSFNIRSDLMLSKRETLRFWYRRSTNDGLNQGLTGGFDLPERAYSTSSTDNTFRVGLTTVASDRLVNEVRVEVSRRDNGQQANSTATSVQVLDAFNSGGNQSSLFSDSRTDGLHSHDDVTYSYGKHTIKFGGRALGDQYSTLNRSNFGGTFTFGSDFLRDSSGNPVEDSGGNPILITPIEAYRNTLLGLPGYHPLQFSIVRGDPFIGFTQWRAGIYALDEWRFSPSLSFSFGVREEIQNHLQDKENIAPRLSVAWSPDKKHFSTIRAGAGLFYTGVDSGITTSTIEFDGLHQQEFVISHPDFFPDIPASFAGTPAELQTTFIKSAGLNMPYAFISSVSYERRLPLGLFGSFSYTYQRGVHLLRSRDINAPEPGTGALPFPNEGPIIQYESTGRSVRHELKITVRTNFNARFSFWANYVLATTKSDTDGASTLPADSYDLSDEYGRAGFDSRHRFFIGGSLSLPWYFRLSPFIFARSGTPFNITTGRDNNGDTLFTDRPAFANPGDPGAIVTAFGVFNPNPQPGDVIIPRNYGNGPSEISVNLNLSKTFGFGSAPTSAGNRGMGGGGHGGWFGYLDPHHRYNLTLNVNARNVLNHTNPSFYNGVLISPLFGLANTAGDPRRIELALRFDF